MADYIYLLQNRLSTAQQAALQTIRDVAKAHSLTVFLVGGAVRDLTSGSPVRDLDVVVQGNALKLKKAIESTGATITGEIAPWQAFFAQFPGGVRVEIGSTLSVAYPKPGKPVMHPATILDDLRRRDFTVNAMALSLNEGSYGLLMDPLNGVADIENRQLRLVSNYGFIEDPVRMIRAARFAARLGWTMDDKTQTRYETGKAEKYIAALSGVHRGYETEEVFHEEDPLRVLRKLEEEGWMKHLFPAMTVGKANSAELDRLREVQTQLQVSGIHPDAAAANFPLLTAKLSTGEVADLKKSFVRQGFVREIEALESEAKEFAAQLAGKNAALPSQAWKLLHAASPEAVLWTAFSSKSATVQAKLKSFHTEWPKARQKVPFPLMQEMRIVPELDRFNEVVETVFFELMDGNLTTVEEQKAFLEPFSPPAPPPPIRLARSRAGKKDGKAAKGKKKAVALLDDDEDPDLDRDLDHEEDGEEESSPTDDEHEDATPFVRSHDDEVEGAPELPSSEPEPVPNSEPVPAVVKPKPKRRSSAPMEAGSTAPTEAAVTPILSTETIAPASNSVQVSEAMPLKKQAAVPSLRDPAKSDEKAGSASAKKTPASANPLKETKTARQKVAPPVKTVSAKQADVPDKKVLQSKPAPPAKSTTVKTASAPSKTPRKKS